VPGEFVSEQNVAKFRALIGPEPVVLPLTLEIGKIQFTAMELRGCGENSSGGRSPEEIEQKVSQRERRKVINGEGFLKTIRRQFSFCEHSGGIVDQDVDP
jgi:hypothetical protein